MWAWLRSLKRYLPTYLPSPQPLDLPGTGDQLSQFRSRPAPLLLALWEEAAQPISSCKPNAFRIFSKEYSAALALSTLWSFGLSSSLTQGPELSEETVTYMSSASHKTAEEDLTTQLFTKQNPCNALVKPETATQLIPAQLPCTLGNAATAAFQVSQKRYSKLNSSHNAL